MNEPLFWDADDYPETSFEEFIQLINLPEKKCEVFQDLMYIFIKKYQ